MAMGIAQKGSDSRSPAERSLLAGFTWAAISVAIFSGWFVVTRFSVTRELRIWDITAIRFSVGALALLPVLLTARLPARAWGLGLVFAVLWGAPFVLLVALGLQLSSAAQAASTAPTLMPVFSGLIGWLVLRERPGKPRLAGYAAIVAGLAILSIATAPANGAFNPSGLIALALAAAMWALYTLIFRRTGLSALQAAALICFWSALLFLPVYLWLGLGHLDHASMQELVLQGIYQGILMSVVAVITFNRAVALLGSAAATAMIALVPVAASLIAIPVLGEVPSLLASAAILIIVTGVVLAARPQPTQVEGTA
ncbi:DMT family transporter [Bosea caraganae]|uniref:DMT family transporter n=1 Tax=Bosea caraganae TaxID=2763117 RepID=A0A370L604_9HYPH|nr:DMT family transporter [Bosea caraganae]RDJ23177.1 DMT family transporter [Bosea caraganae]RDJ24710.1 DMT family transporter [Bosea caraganae]